jgi:hypothetical protein
MHSLAYSIDGLMATMIAETRLRPFVIRRAERRIGIPTDLVDIPVDSSAEYPLCVA